MVNGYGSPCITETQGDKYVVGIEGEENTCEYDF